MPERSIAHRSDIQVERMLLSRAFLYRHHQSILADRKTDSGRGHFRTQQFGKTVVTSTAKNRVLGTKRPVRNFKSGARVVIKTSHKPRLDCISDLPVIRKFAHPQE